MDKIQNNFFSLITKLSSCVKGDAMAAEIGRKQIKQSYEILLAEDGNQLLFGRYASERKQSEVLQAQFYLYLGLSDLCWHHFGAILPEQSGHAASICRSQGDVSSPFGAKVKLH